MKNDGFRIFDIAVWTSMVFECSTWTFELLTSSARPRRLRMVIYIETSVLQRPLIQSILIREQ